MTTNPATSPGRFPDFIKGLLSAIGAHNDVVAEWLRRYMGTRVRSIGLRVAKLLQQLHDGTYRAARPRARTAKTTPHSPRGWVPRNIASSVPADAKQPTRWGWMRRMLRSPTWRPYSGPASGEILAGLLQNAEMADLARACPSLGRQLRPLCHMLGVKLPDYLKRPPRDPASPRQPRAPRQPRPIPPPPAAPPPPRPLPYAVVSSTVGPSPSTSLSICGLKSWTPVR